MGTHDRGVGGEELLDRFLSAFRDESGLGDSSQDRVVGAVGGVAEVSFPHGLPGSELFRQIPPGAASAVAPADAFEYESVVGPRAAAASGSLREQMGDRVPQVVRDHFASRHAASVSTIATYIKETRPSRSPAAAVGASMVSTSSLAKPPRRWYRMWSAEHRVFGGGTTPRMASVDTTVDGCRHTGVREQLGMTAAPRFAASSPNRSTRLGA